MHSMKRQAPLKSILLKKEEFSNFNNIAAEKKQYETSECPIAYEDWHNIRDRTEQNISDNVIKLFIQHANWSVNNSNRSVNNRNSESIDYSKLTSNESKFALEASEIYNVSAKETKTLYLRIKQYFR